MLQTVILTISLFIAAPNLVSGQGFDSRFHFEGNLDDEAAVTELSVVGNEVYEDGTEGQALHLAGESYTAFPTTLSGAILTDQSFFLSVDFMVPDRGTDESYRILFGNKPWAYDVPGFSFRVMNEKEEWQPNQTLYLNYNIGGGDGREIAGRFLNIPMDVWHTARIFVDFATETVTFSLNGRSVSQSLREDIVGNDFDPGPFLERLASAPIHVGGPTAFNEGEEIAWYNPFASGGETLADMHIDNLLVSSPRSAGNVGVISQSLSRLEAHVRGSDTLDDATLSTLQTTVKSNLFGIPFEDVEPAVRSFVGAHNQMKPLLYDATDGGHVAYEDFPPESKSYVDVGIWMMREGLTPASAGLSEGMTLQEHAAFPGIVDDAAERVADGHAEVNATYVKDPFYNMGDMQTNEANELSAFVYRPTGFYAPPGEVVTVRVDESLVDTGLHIRVGAHKYDHTVFDRTNRFPVIKVDYRIESSTMEVVNPLGGGIYVLVPLHTDLGWVGIEMDGAIRAPFFSTRTGRITSELEWEIIRNHPAPLADFESDKYMFTVPSHAIRDFDRAGKLLSIWNEIMDTFQIVHGRPLERYRSEAFMFDTRTSVEGSFPGGYPVTPGLWSQRNGDVKEGTFSPFAPLSQELMKLDDGFTAMLHEMAHHHLGYVMTGEIETFVDVPFAAVLNRVFDNDFDEGVRHGTGSLFNRTDGAIHWMVTDNFRNGDPIGLEQSAGVEFSQLSYQARGSAKYSDLADVFGGWEAVGAVSKTFYDEDVAAGAPVTYASQPEVTRDHYLLNGSAALGCNLASLFHFWGIHPSEAASAQLETLPPCQGADERIKTYLRAAPRTNNDVRVFHAERTAVFEHVLNGPVWERLFDIFDTSHGRQIRDVGAAILKRYFGTDPDEPPTAPVLVTTEFTTSGAPSDPVTFSWTSSEDPEGDALSYSWRLYDAQTGETLIARSWVEATEVAIETSELAAALDRYANATDWVPLIQEVTTADAFTVVTSVPLRSNYLNGVGTDVEAGTLPGSFDIESVYPNPFGESTTIRYVIPEPRLVTIVVIDALGRVVSRPAEEEPHAAGTHIKRFAPADLAPGLYFLRVRAGQDVVTRPLVRLK